MERERNRPVLIRIFGAGLLYKP